ncbi:MAG: Ku protein [Candidatus Eremiobacteraeota bacterium]|nr:Ku protein [Candidatus Eremiobacteraeota bacterium]MBC5827118.1 Ku protein [Candidatus Eremiobacteraeota bacterium]
MAHAIWSGSINFGLVTIPVKLYTAVRENELHFNMLHAADQGRIKNVRTCGECGKTLEWSDLVKGYEYQKGEYVILSDDDFAKVNVEATQSIDIVQFVDINEINPMMYEKPYYLEPEKKGRHAYALLREALKKAGKVGVAKVVIRTREYLAALKPNGDALILELMHFADEIVDSQSLDIPKVEEKVPLPEMKVAMMLIDTMAAKFDPSAFQDTYREQLMTMIDARAQGKPLPKAKKKAAAPEGVVNLMDVLQRSLEQTGKRRVTTAPGKKDAGEKRRAKAVA